jgi:hypothetical protein
MAKEAPTTLRGNKGHGDKEWELSELASVNASIIRDEIISNTKIFADTISY